MSHAPIIFILALQKLPCHGCLTLAMATLLSMAIPLAMA
jgi:hypothetical protein